MTTTYARYLKAAKRKNVADPASIFEVAASDPDLTAKQRGQLAGELHDRHGFKLTKAQRDPLIDALVDAGLSPTEIAKRIGCSPRTVSRRQAAEVGSTNGMDKRRRPDKTRRHDSMIKRAEADAYLRSVGRWWVDPSNVAEGTRAATDDKEAEVPTEEWTPSEGVSAR